MVRIAPVAVVALLSTLAPAGAPLVPHGPEVRGAVSSANCSLVASGGNGPTWSVHFYDVLWRAWTSAP